MFFKDKEKIKVLEAEVKDLRDALDRVSNRLNVQERELSFQWRFILRASLRAGISLDDVKEDIADLNKNEINASLN